MSTPLQPASDERALGKPLEGWRLRLYTIIFEADTRAGQLFDRWLIAVILLSLAVVVAGSVNALQVRFETPFTVMEWLFTVIFTLEYVARLVCVRHPLRYATSFFGIVDLLAILPTYLCGDDLASGALVSVLDDHEPQVDFGRNLYACYLPSRSRVAKVKQFLAQLEALLTPIPPWDRYREGR